MTKFSLNLYSIYFGISPRVAIDTKKEVSKDGAKVDTQANVSLPEETVKGMFGTPILLPTYIDEWLLPNEPAITIDGGKNIVFTEISGREGTFQEEWSLRDYDVSIRGFLIENELTDNRPEALIRKLRSICEKPGSIKVRNDLFTYFNIQKAVITDYSFPHNQGMTGVQPYELKLKSSKDIVLELS